MSRLLIEIAVRQLHKFPTYGLPLSINIRKLVCAIIDLELQWNRTNIIAALVHQSLLLTTEPRRASGDDLSVNRLSSPLTALKSSLISSTEVICQTGKWSCPQFLKALRRFVWFRLHGPLIWFSQSNKKQRMTFNSYVPTSPSSMGKFVTQGTTHWVQSYVTNTWWRARMTKIPVFFTCHTSSYIVFSDISSNI